MSARPLRLALAVALLGLGLALGAPGLGCSLDNQEGPDVTCADLKCGKVNACEDGIIAQCVDGKTVKWHVCSTDDVCTATWQKEGQYRCTEEATDCEGCRPERAGCDDLPPLGGGGSGGGAATGTGGAGGAGGG